jgi:hypothetical protein
VSTPGHSEVERIRRMKRKEKKRKEKKRKEKKRKESNDIENRTGDLQAFNISKLFQENFTSTNGLSLVS